MWDLNQTKIKVNFAGTIEMNNLLIEYNQLENV